MLVTGPTGAGKTEEMKYLIDKFNVSRPTLKDGKVARIASCILENKDGWKGLGKKTLSLLGYELAPTSRNTQQDIWRKVLLQAKAQGVVGIHYDEAQHIFQGKSPAERFSMLDSLKTLMKSHDWPLMLILSGMPELAGHVREEPQLSRLLTPVELKDINIPNDFETLHELVSSYSLDADLGMAEDLATEDFYDRLATGASLRWGLAILIVKHAIEQAKITSESVLRREHFVRAWTGRTGVTPIQTPFLHDRYMTAFPRDRVFWTHTRHNMS